MKMQSSTWNKSLAAILGLCLCAALDACAQGRGGFGGFGGFNRGNASSQQQNQYTPNGQVGTASISLDDSGNLIVIGDEATIAQIKQVVANLDRPQPQVLIKVVFLEVQHNNSSDIGVEGAFGKNIGNSMTGTAANVFGLNGLNTLTTNFNAVGPAPAVPALTPSSTSPGAGLYQILGSDFQATLRAIAQAGKAQLLSRPSILARDRQPATIVVGQSVPLITSVTYVGTSGFPVNNIQYTEVGIILKVTPYITPDGLVQMIVQPQTSSLDPTQKVPIATGVDAPVIDVREADTVVTTPDGQTVVIGGLMENTKSSSDNKIPFLGDIPLLGNLFKRSTKSNAKTELLIFLTPHIVRTPGEMASMSRKEQGQNYMIPQSFSEEELNRFLENVPVKKEK